MGKDIKKREGLFKTIKRYKDESLYEKRQKELESNPDAKLEKNDVWALLLSSFLVIVLPCLLILCFIVFVAMLFFRLL